MMMARNSPPKHPQLDPASTRMLESALLVYLANPTSATELQEVLRRIATEAREKKMHAEHLLIALKDVWFGLPQIQKAPDNEAQQRLLQKVVTLCIREYYAT
jgi:hypothetical protein